MPKPESSIYVASRTPKLLLLIDGMAAITDGGTERQLLQLVQIARKAGLAPTIAVLRATAWLTPELAGCPVRLGCLASLRTLDGWRELGRLALWMRRERFAILQTYFVDANLLGPLLGRLVGVPTILGTRRSLNPLPGGPPIPGAPTRGPLARLVRRISNTCLTRLLTNAEAVSENILATEPIRPAQIEVAYNGVDLDALRVDRAEGASVRKALHLVEGHILIGSLSGLRPVKRLDLFVRAAGLAVARAPELRFVLVGEGEMREPLGDLIATLGLEGIVQLAGAADQVRSWLAAFDVSVLCSEAEGFSNTILESMAAGLPVIATEVGGNREALGEVLAGCLVPSGDAQALAEAMVRMADAGERRRCSTLALAQVQRFSLRAAEQRMATIYQAHCPALDPAPLVEQSRPAPQRTPQMASDMHATKLSRVDDPV